jgi:hypothetical protein
MKEVFPIIPAGAGSVWFLVGIGLLLLTGAAFLGYLAFSCRSASVEVTPAGLNIRAAFYGRQIPLSSLVPTGSVYRGTAQAGSSSRTDKRRWPLSAILIVWRTSPPTQGTRFC